MSSDQRAGKLPGTSGSERAEYDYLIGFPAFPDQHPARVRAAAVERTTDDKDGTGLIVFGAGDGSVVAIIPIQLSPVVIRADQDGAQAL